MKIEKAIELLTKDVEEGYYEAESPVEDAAKLGIEALKRVKLEHEREGVKVKWLLPGETEE